MIEPLPCEEVAEELDPDGSEDGLGVELDAFDGQLAVAQAHDGAVAGLGGTLQLAGQAFPLDDERVVARGGEPLGELAENGLAVVQDFAGLAVHDFARADYPAAKGIADCLVS